MDTMEQIKLTLSSKRIEGYMKLVNNKRKGHCIVQYNASEVSIYTLNGPRLYYGKRELNLKNPAITSQDLEPWINEELTFLENTVNLFERYRKAFPFEKCSLVINPRIPVNIKEILESPIYEYCVAIYYDKQKVETKDLDAIMEAACDGKAIEIEFQDMPLDYDHENAFKFSYNSYGDARWVRLHHLLSLNNRQSVILGENNFGSEDMNAFLKFWVNSDHDMVRCLHIFLWKTTRSSTLFEGLIVLKISRFGNTYWLLAANAKKSGRKHPIMSIWYDDQTLQLDTWLLNETFNEKLPYDHVGGVTLAKEYKILLILQDKKDMEEKLKEENSAEKRDEIEESIRKCEKELDIQDVYFDEGIPVVG